ncbi:unnamed protein product [Mytilus edulis]|uniref:Uncharacterized protein n=1 Tax=Mytilus edulis TaxID=6550 RepID=A0A8S3TDI5_MYTED|nr:unnamed protein product [Mytilus edulis]
MQCEPGQHIHIETISIDNEKCPSKPSSTSIDYFSIPNLTCHGISNCNVPFKLAPGFNFNKYLKIQYTCLGCKSATRYSTVHIMCKPNTGINIHDVWMNWKTACPAYKTTHKTNFSYIHTECHLKQACKVTNNQLHIMSIYFNCVVLTTTNMMSTTTTLSVNTMAVLSFHSETPPGYSTSASTAKNSNTSHHILMPVENTLADQSKEIFPAGAVAGGVVTVIIIIFLLIGVLLYRTCGCYKITHSIRNNSPSTNVQFYRRRNNDHSKSPRKQFVTRSNPAYESDMDVGTDGNPNKNKDSSLYQHYFEIQNDPDIVTPTHSYINTVSITYDYANIGPFKDDTFDNMKQEDRGKRQLEEFDSNTYSHLQDTCNDSNENTYNHTIHDRVQETSENDYSMSRGQMSEDDYDVSGNHYRGNHKKGSENVYN